MYSHLPISSLCNLLWLLIFETAWSLITNVFIFSFHMLPLLKTCNLFWCSSGAYDFPSGQAQQQRRLGGSQQHLAPHQQNSSSLYTNPQSSSSQLLGQSARPNYSYQQSLPRQQHCNSHQTQAVSIRSYLSSQLFLCFSFLEQSEGQSTRRTSSHRFAPPKQWSTSWRQLEIPWRHRPPRAPSPAWALAHPTVSPFSENCWDMLIDCPAGKPSLFIPLSPSLILFFHLRRRKNRILTALNEHSWWCSNKNREMI